MKKQLVAFSLVVAAVCLVSAPSWAFTSKKIQAVNASASVGGVKDATFTLVLRNLSDTADAASIAFSGVTAGSTGWKVADNLIKLTWSVTDFAGGIQLYTDSENAAASPKYTGVAVNPGGLVCNQDTTQYLPVAWSIKADTKTIELADANRGLGASDPNSGAVTGYNNKYQWFWAIDKSSPSFTNATPFITVAKSAGIHFSQGDGEFGPDAVQPSYMYLEANFSVAGAGATYATNNLTLEAFIQ